VSENRHAQGKLSARSYDIRQFPSETLHKLQDVCRAMHLAFSDSFDLSSMQSPAELQSEGQSCVQCHCIAKALSEHGLEVQ